MEEITKNSEHSLSNTLQIALTWESINYDRLVVNDKKQGAVATVLAQKPQAMKRFSTKRHKTSNKRKYHTAPRKCYNCGERTHKIAYCPNMLNNDSETSKQVDTAGLCERRNL